MEKLLQARIEIEARKKLSKWRAADADRKRKFERYQKKTGMHGPYRPLPQPRSWSFSPQFHPTYCISRARYLAKVITRKVREGTYKPHSAARVEIRKPNGGFREIDCFGIPDTALCTLLSKAIRLRNDKEFSAFSYAYRDGSKPIDGVSRLRGFLHAEKVFVSKYDFKDYFGSVDHGYIEREILNSRRFKLTSFERTVIHAIIRHSFTTKDGQTHQRSLGFPQGNSLSLFLANAVGDHLDSSLDRTNGNYVRYADDSVVVSNSYEDAICAIDAFSNFSRQTGVKVNREKETGISIVADRKGEMRTLEGVDFLGYYISKSRINLSQSTIKKIKGRCSRIIYNNLLMYPKRYGYVNSRRFGKFGADWDLLACIAELRLMMYGTRSQQTIERYLSGRSRIKSMAGNLSYYCLVSRVDDFRMLDGWLIWSLQRSLTERYTLLRTFNSSLSVTAPSKDELLTGDWLRAYRRLDGKIPSFVLTWRASRKAFYSFGNLRVDNGRDVYSDY